MRKILVIGPVSPQEEDLLSLKNTLSFLAEEYIVDCVDSLSIHQDVSNERYYQLWKQKLMCCIPDYDAFFGFAFGGVILQQCFSLFATMRKPIILFSTPTFADCSLTQKLGRVIRLCKENKLEHALNALYQPVFYPNLMPPLAIESMNQSVALERLIFGLTRVLHTDATDLLKENKVPHLHLIGECSALVNTENVIAANNGHLIVVPKASMRVLQDNLSYCKKIIEEVLNSGSC